MVENYLEDLSIRRPCSSFTPVGISPQAHTPLAPTNREIQFRHPIKIMGVKRGWGGPITTGGGGDGRTVGVPFSPLSGRGLLSEADVLLAFRGGSHKLNSTLRLTALSRSNFDPGW